MTTYPTPEPIRLDVRIPAGRIEIRTAHVSETSVEVRRLRAGSTDAFPEEVRQLMRPPRGDGREVLYVAVEQGFRRWSGRDSYEVMVSTPHDADVAASTASASVTGRGRFRSVDVRTASGDVSFEDVTDAARVKSASGDVALGRVGASVEASTTSGDMRIEATGGELVAALVSGHLSVGRADGNVRARTVSGDVSLRSVNRGRVDVTTVSGDAQINVLPGRRVWMDLVSSSGDTSCELNGFGADSSGPAATTDLEIHARAVSGAIRVRAEAPAEGGAN